MLYPTTCAMIGSCLAFVAFTGTLTRAAPPAAGASETATVDRVIDRVPTPTGVAESTIYLKDLCDVMRTDWPNNRSVRIVFHGHSVPAGYFKTPEVRTLLAYPNLLHAAVAEKYPRAVANVVVTAIGGENSVSGAERFAADVLTLKPDVVTIDYGLNDRGVGLPAAKAAWSKMIEAALAAKVKVILCTPTPDQSARLDDPADPLNQHAEQIRALAAQYHVGLVDSLAAFQQYVKAGHPLESVMSQVNHPNAAGHQLVLEQLAPWFGIEPIVPTVAK